MVVNKFGSIDIINSDHDLVCSGTTIHLEEELPNGYFKCKCLECGYEFIDG